MVSDDRKLDIINIQMRMFYFLYYSKYFFFCLGVVIYYIIQCMICIIKNFIFLYQKIIKIKWIGNNNDFSFFFGLKQDII